VHNKCNEYGDEMTRNLTDILSQVRLLAQVSHAGQVDKVGKPYFMHAEMVSRTVGDLISSWHLPSEDFSLKAQIVGYLHDTLEDTQMTMDDLWKHKIPTECMLAVEAITKVDGVTYQDYLMNVKRCKLAAVVKVADMMHNSDLSRLDNVTEEDLTRREKYQKAITFLSDFTCEKCGQTLPLSVMGEKSTRIDEILCQPCLDQYEIEYDDYEDWLKGD